MRSSQMRSALPILGILINPSYKRALIQNKAPSAKVMLKAAKEMGMDLFFLTEDGINRFGEWVGLKRKCQKWVEEEAYPDIVYNKAYSSSRATTKYLAAIPNIQQVNDRIGYWKWEVHEALKIATPKAPWLLKTLKFRNLDQLDWFCDEDDVVFIKPSQGLKSMGVVRIEKVEGVIYYEYRGKGKEKFIYKKGNVNSIEELPLEIKKWFTGEDYVIQKGVDLAEIEGRCFDLRVLGQKDGHGEWRLYPKARVGSLNFSITTLGLWGDANAVLSEAFPNRMILPKVLETAREILLILDLHFARAGEVGLDLAVDQQGRVYFLEANSMPGKGMFSGVEFEEILTNPIRYAKFLYNH
jgi:hypothetical protein